MTSKAIESRNQFDLCVVVIGRNEGDRLVRCLDSILAQACPVVYVDSASTDDSVSMARRKGADVVELDMRIPFTAARARNAGFVRARQVAPLARWVQFVDGDCELIDGWILAARTFLDEQAEVACVCGVLRERFPEHSIYNRIADQAVTLPSGPIEACGGIVMLRVDVLERVGLFREDLVAGEEPELCVRLRRAGWKVWRLSIPMAWHDSAMTRFGQWWRRTRRVGYAYAQAVGMYGLSDAGAVRRAARAWIWGAVVPLGVLCAVAALGPWALLLLLAYPLQILRSAASMGGRSIDRLCSASFMMLGKFPELLGQCQYFLTRQGEARSNAFHKS